MCVCVYIYIYTLTYLLTPWSRVLLEKLTGFQLVKKFPAFYGTRKFITAFTSARHLFLSWANSIQSIPPHPTYWISNLILSSHLRLGLPSGLFSSGFPTRILYTPFLSPISATYTHTHTHTHTHAHQMAFNPYWLWSSCICNKIYIGKQPGYLT